MFTFVVLADVSEEVGSSAVLNGVRVDSVDDEVWDVGVWWGESFNLKSLFVLKSISSWALHAGHDSSGVINLSFSSALGGNFLIVGSGIISFNTLDEVESLMLGWLSLNKIKSTDLHKVVLALNFSMLALESPLSVLFGRLGFSSVSIWMKGDVSHSTEAFGGLGLGDGTGNCSSASWALGLVVEINLHFSFAFVSSTDSGKSDDVEEFHISLDINKL